MADDTCSTKRCTKCSEAKAPTEFSRNARYKDGLEPYCRCCKRSINKAGWDKHGERRGTKEREKRRLERESDPEWLRKQAPEGFKWCPRCERVLEHGAFAKSATRHSGLSPWCRECKAADHQRYMSDPEIAKAHRDYNAAYYRENTEAHHKRTSTWRKANPEANKAINARHRQRHAERRRERQALYDKARAERKREWSRKRRQMYPDKFRAYVASRRARLAGAAGSYTQSDVRRILEAQRGRCAYCRVLMRGKHTVDHIVALHNGGTNHPRNLQLTCGPCNSSKRIADPLVYARRLGRLL